MALPKFLANIGHAVSNFVGGIGSALAGTPTDQQKKKRLQQQQVAARIGGGLGLAPSAPVAPSISHTTVPFKPVVAVRPPVIAVPRTTVASPNIPSLLNTIKLAPKPQYAMQPTIPGAAPVAAKIGGIASDIVRPPTHLLQIDIANPLRETAAQITNNKIALQHAKQSQNRLLRPQQLAGDIGTTLLDAATLGTGTVAKEGATQAITALGPKIVSKALVDATARRVAGETGKLGLKEVARAIAKDVGVQTSYAASSAASEDKPLTRQSLRSATASGLVFGGVGGGLVHSPDIIKGIRKLPAIVRTTTLKAAAAESPVQHISTDLLTSYEKADRATVDQYKQQIKNGEQIDPLIVMPDHTGNLGVEDGKNRLQAYKELGVKSVPVQLTTPTRLQTALQSGSVKLPGIPEPLPTGANEQLRLGPGAQPVALPSGKTPEQIAAGTQVAATPEQALGVPLSDQASRGLAVNDNLAPTNLNTTATNDLRLAGDGTPIKGTNVPSDIALADNGKATRYASKTVPESDVVSQELQKTVKEGAPTYQVATEHAGLKESLNRMQTQGIDGLATDVNARLESPLGTISRQDVFDAETVAAALDVLHDPESLQRATDIYDKISAHLTAAGQTIQAAAIIARRSPEGLRQFAQTQLNRAGVTLTPELQTGLQDVVDAIRKTNPGTEERNLAVAGLMQFIGKNVPTGTVDKLVGVYKASLLTGLRTQTGNALSNSILFGLKKASDVVATAADVGIGLLTGKRSKALTGAGIAPGVVEGTQKGVKYLKTGIDERQVGDKFQEVSRQLNFKNKALNATVNGVFRLMGAADQPVWYATYRNNLQDLARVEAKNQGLRGSKARTFVKDFAEHPTEQAQALATDAATRAVLGNDTIASKAVAAVNRALQNHPVAKGAFNVVMPFTKVPSAYIARIFRYTPVGVAKEVLDQLVHKKFDQRKFVEALGDSAVGTGGLMTLGAGLSKAGLLTGAYPTDPKEQQAWKAEGKQEYSIKIGNKWRSLNYVGPGGAVIGIGGNFEKALSSGSTVGEALAASTTGAVQSAVGQSFLSGVSGLLDAINQPERSAKQYLNQEAASVVPTLIGDIAKAGDKTQRQTNSPVQAIQGKIPGAREKLLPKQDAFGNQLSSPEGPIGTLVDPLHSSTALDTPLTQELDRLQGVKQGVFPTPSKSLQVGTETVKLTPTQQNAFNQNVGQQVQSVWNDIIKSPDYQGLLDDGKKNVLQTAMDDINSVEKANMLRTVGRSDLADKIKLTSQQKLVSQGNLTPQDYVQKEIDKQAGVSSNNVIIKVKAMDTTTRDNYLADPKNNYAYQLALFQDNVKGNKLSDVQQYTKSLEIGKLAVLSNYSRDANELYGLSKKQLATYLADHQIPQKTADELQTLDNELYQKGFISSLKYAGGLSGSGKRAPSPPKPHFGKLGLVSPPKISIPNAKSEVDKFKAKAANIAALRLKVAPERKSRIKLAV